MEINHCVLDIQGKMKFFIIFVALMAITEAIPLSKEVMDTWTNFKARHGKSYSTEEESTRLSTFLQNKVIIDAHNKLYEEGKSTYTMAVNHLADLTKEERAKMRGYLNQTHVLRSGHRQTYQKRGIPIPDSIDWREYGYVTGVKDQGQCGSCWAFGTIASLEGQHFRYTGQLVSLSEQQLVDCSGMNCDGGRPDPAFTYIINNGGVETEEEYPYEAANGQCSWNGHAAATIKGFVDNPTGDEVSLKEMLAENGPITVTIDGSEEGFSFYNSGVYYDPNCDKYLLDHIVLAVGYGTAEMDYWIVKNSWGEGYGQGGYILMARNADDHCGIAMAASYPLV